MTNYQYVKSINRYRNVQNGLFVSREEVLSYVARIAEAGNGSMDALAQAVADKTISPADYISALRAEIKTSAIQQAILGRGGRASMTFTDWGSVGRHLRGQYSTLPGFQKALEESERSAAYISNRARPYFDRTREMYERANARAYGCPTLPAYAGDLTSECMASDSCCWIIERLPGQGNFNCVWTLGAAEHCDTCLERSIEWAPLRVVGGQLQPYRTIRAETHDHHHAAIDLD